MKIVVSIPVHEKKDVVIDQIENIKRYIYKPIIVLHISKEFYNNEGGNFQEIEELEDVYINSIHYSVGWGNIAHVHISNFNYISNITDFDYFLLHASNDMYIKPQIEDYIKQYDAGFCRRILRYEKTMWWPCQKAHEDLFLKEIMQDHGIDEIVATQVEGSFYKKKIFEKIINYIGIEDISGDEIYTKEEIYFSTIAYALINKSKLGYPTTYSEVHQYDMGLWKIQRFLYSFWKFPVLKNFATENVKNKIYYKIVKRYEERKHYAINKHVIDRIVKGDKKYVLRHSKMNDYPGKFYLYDGNIFSVKRVARDMDDEIRIYIRGMNNK